MPNWVFNTLDNYPKELYEKYKGEDRDIEFNKIIPEPEEISNTPSGGYNDVAKNIYNYKQYINNVDKKDMSWIQHDRSNPLREPVRRMAENTTITMGELVIEDPDTPLKDILDREDNKYKKKHYDNYVSVFGNRAYRNCKDFDKIYDNYINNEESCFKAMLEKPTKFNEVYKQYDSLEDMGKKLIEMKDKYGYDNWYDWRNANWGTKWDACDSQYNEETQSVQFNTAWSIPYPVLAKIAQDNPEVNIEGYSEEETGWFDEYTLEDGAVYLNATGELTYDDETDSTTESKETLNPPKVFSYDQLLEENKKAWNSIKAVTSSIF